MRMKPWITAFVIVSLFTACNPAQPVAERDLQVAATQFRTITADLAVKAKYQAMMASLHVIKTSKNPEEREAAFISCLDEYQEVEFLLVQAERAQGLLSHGRQWVREQRGIFKVLIEETQQAKARADEKNKLTTVEQ